MKRYECLTQAPFDMEETPDGAWVFFDDVQEAITAAVAAEREKWMSAALAVFAADDEYGAGFYNYGGWMEAYAKLREMTEQ